MSEFFGGLFAAIGIGLAIAAFLVLEATGLYIAGRIVLPELGIQPLEWWTIVWAVLWVGVFSLPIYLLKGLFDKL